VIEPKEWLNTSLLEERNGFMSSMLPPEAAKGEIAELLQRGRADWKSILPGHTGEGQSNSAESGDLEPFLPNSCTKAVASRSVRSGGTPKSSALPPSGDDTAGDDSFCEALPAEARCSFMGFRKIASASNSVSTLGKHGALEGVDVLLKT
jgi:hypothetical protein